eukprot:CAMPEP_0206468804 /NCGR_PEP_ID=MMETSP0324_2-20121206/29866_1 /ASSEMBLY_ACC=CAM_ASM_000836 /TAXON_ID=2866 /ORGANISM="Crypthecodinium cohnii, Strain Seligo" /LENGTH=327 /DNA_ID=CAMNT_0053942369 /DNA_START=389 /DNA_END=1372 /DNA_ORIENTATION=+
MICTSGGSYKTDVTYVYPTTSWEELGFANETDPGYLTWVQYNMRVTLWGWVGKNCTNPNDISIHVETYQNGTLFMELPQSDGTVQKLESGESWIPQVEFVKQEGGHQRTYNTFDLSMPLVGYMQMTGLPVDVIQSLYVRTTHDLTMLGMKFQTVKDKVKWCAYKADFVKGIMGETVCEDTYEEAKANVPAFDWVDPSNFSTVELSDEDRENGEKGRDLLCGVVMGIGFLLGAGSTAAFVWVMRHWLCPETFPRSIQKLPLAANKSNHEETLTTQQVTSDTQQSTSNDASNEEVAEINPDQVEILDLEQAANDVKSEASDTAMDPWSL